MKKIQASLLSEQDIENENILFCVIPAREIERLAHALSIGQGVFTERDFEELAIELTKTRIGNILFHLVLRGEILPTVQSDGVYFRTNPSHRAKTECDDYSI